MNRISDFKVVPDGESDIIVTFHPEYRTGDGSGPEVEFSLDPEQAAAVAKQLRAAVKMTDAWSLQTAAVEKDAVL